MSQTLDEEKPDTQTQPDGTLSDSELEQVSGGAYQSRDFIDWNPEIEYGEP